MLIIKKGLFYNFVLSTNLIIALISNLIDIAGYIRDFSGLLKLFKN